MGIFDKLFGRPSPRAETRKVTLKDPLILRSPKIGFLNLIGAAARPLIEEYRAALVGLFSGEVNSERDPPLCDVLFVYANVLRNGVIEGSFGSFREITDRTNASIVVFASENDPKGYIAGGSPSGSRRVNLVMTLERKGRNFGDFFAKLFRAMKSGTTMPMAWVQLAPQIPGKSHEDCPSTIFSAEISHILFQ